MANAALNDANIPRKKRSIRVSAGEDDYYIRKIEELANERLIFYRKMELYKEQFRASLIERQPSTSTGEDDREKKEYLRDEQVNDERKKRKAKSIKRKATSTGEDDRKKKKKKIVRKKPVRKPVVDNEITHRLKEFIVNEMKGSDLKLVIQKMMFESDTKKGLNRLNMPVNQLETNEFLTEDEWRIFSNRDGKEKEIEVPLLGPTLEMYEDKMKLKMWHMNTSANFVLTTNWHRFWKENKAHLAERSTIQAWSFRRDEQLCFAVACVGKPDD